MWRELKLGDHCHWCGAEVPYGHIPRTGKHLFCPNQGKCKMAHARAYAKYLLHVTHSPTPGDIDASSPAARGNAPGKPPTPTSSSGIAVCRQQKGNARKRG
jgi:hypothetical protein